MEKMRRCGQVTTSEISCTFVYGRKKQNEYLVLSLRSSLRLKSKIRNSLANGEKLHFCVLGGVYFAVDHLTLRVMSTSNDEIDKSYRFK